jgi:hypothetical protein
MTITMTASRIKTIQDIVQFLNGTISVSFLATNKQQSYAWIERQLVKFTYATASKSNKGLIKQYLKKVTGYSRSQITRLIHQYLETGRVKPKEYERATFARKYFNEDVILLAKTDDLHDYPNGNALKIVCSRMYHKYKDEGFKRLANISPAHIYNLRQDLIYKKLNKAYQKTKPRVVNIGKRKKPQPNGRPGCIQVDTVHQGDEDGEKGVYHINMVGMVTQWEVIAAVEKITERYLLPIIIRLLKLFPFTIYEFHADNGSEFINQLLARLLNKLLIELTKGRPRRPNDNALVETKNGSVIRKWISYAFISAKDAELVNDFYFGSFHEYLNFHRPCGFASTITDSKGKQKKIYKPGDYMTPYDKLKSLPNAEQYLKPAMSFKILDEIAMRYTDNQMAQLVQSERDRLNRRIYQSL